MSASPQPKILVIRGGAIGDFLLTLPAIGMLREAFPHARLEILGYEHIISLATSGGFADATRSIEYAALAGFFNPKGTLDLELAAYFASFQQVVSYLYDPDGFFAGNLRRSGVKNLIEASPKIDEEGDHAVRQLAHPLERLALYLHDDGELRLQPSPADRAFADRFLQAAADDRPLVAIHPGSGGERKNWLPDRWEEMGRFLLAEPPAKRPRLLLVGGESDGKTLNHLRAAWRSVADKDDLLVAENLSLPNLAAVLARCRLFLGHDSGISHLAAVVGVRCLLLFGPTDPDIWAPPHATVQVLRAPEGVLSALTIATVRDRVAAVLGIHGEG